jgi:hypothetical protein
MAASALKEFQIAVRTQLEDDVVLQNMRYITGVFDEAPNDQPYPYITIGTKVEVPYNVFQVNGYEDTLVLDMWTDLNGGDIHLDLLDDVNRLFNNPRDEEKNFIPLQMPSWNNILCEVEWSTTLIDESDICRHTIARLRAINT